MDTEKMFFLNGELDNISFRELSENELEISRHHVEITRHLQEIHQLFLMLKYNIECLQNNYILMNSGDVFCNQQPAESEEDYIAINAHTTNIISSGRTLVESMECYINNNSHIDSASKNEYLKCYRDTYDASFAYRLLIRLRDFSQHGHLPVCNTGFNYYFDLKQITDKPHFNHNKTLKQQMEGIVDEIITVYRNTPKLSLTQTIAEFVAKLFFIYKKFWVYVESELKESCTNFQNIIKAYPENMVNNDSAFTGLFIYEFEDGMAQASHINDDSQIIFDNFKKESETICDEYTKKYKKLFDNSLWIRCIDKKIIEIGSGLFGENKSNTSEQGAK